MITVRGEKRGFTLVEVLVSVFLFSLILMAVTNGLSTALNLQHRIKVAKAINNSAITAFERMSRDIRNATGIIDSSSTFDTHPGVLTLQIPSIDGNPATVVTFSLSDDAVQVAKDSVNEGPLTTGVAVDNLVFRHLTNGDLEAIRIEMTLRASSHEDTLTQNFYSTIVPRGSY